MIGGKFKLGLSVCVALFVFVRSSPLPNAERSRKNDVANEPRIGIIVSPLMSSAMVREIAIYWEFGEHLRRGEDSLSLYEGRPEVDGGGRALYHLEVRAPSGVRKTRVGGDFVPTLNLTYQDRCLNYHVAWRRNGVIRKVKCLATHPNWMSLRRATLGSKRLNEIFIPGTHDSGAYNKDENKTSETIVNKYLITQDEDILSQLIYGVRYLDIRVGRHPSLDPVWWVNHGIFSVHPLQTVIDDVKHFLDNTREIVIFDVHEFPVGFEIRAEEAHRQLISFLEEQFAGYFLPKTTKGWGITLNEIWATGKRLIIGYNKKDVYQNYESTWQAVNHRWPNVKTLDELYAKIESYENGADSDANNSRTKRPPSSVMAQFTPETVDVILDLLGGIRQMSEVVNMNVTGAYNERWRCSANIVSMDYIKGSGIIEAALEWNDRRPLVC